MAEEIVLAELRADARKWNADLQGATKSADKATNAISEAFGRIDESVKDLPGNFKKFNDELNDVHKHAGHAAAGISKIGSAIGTAFKATVIGSVIALGAAIVKLGTMGFQASQSLEATDRQLTKLMGSSQAAAKEMAFVRAETERLGLSTAEGAKGFAQLATAAQGTIAQGEGVRQIFSAINELAVVSNLTQEEYATLLQQTTQGINKQKFELEDLKSISEAGVPIFQTMIKALNTTPDNLFKAISAGKIGVKELMVTMQQLREENGKFAEEAANTIPAKIKGGFRELTTGIADIFRGLFASKELNEMFSDMAGRFDIKLPGKEEVTRFVDDVVGGFRDMLAIVATIFEALINVIKKAWQGAVDWIRDQTTKIGSHFKEGSELIGKLWDSTLGGWFNKAADTVGKATDAVVDNVSKATDKIGPGLLWAALGVDKGKEPESLKELDAALRKAAGLQAKANEEINDQALSSREKALEEEKRLQDKYAKDNEKRQDESSKRINNSQSKEDENRIKRQAEALKKMQEAASDNLVKVIDEQNKRIAEEAEKAMEMAADAIRTGTPVLPPVESKEQLDAIEEAQKTYDNMKENVQETLAGLISDSIKGDLGNIKDMLDNVLDMFASFAAEAASKFVIDSVFDEAVDFLAGKMNDEGKRSGGLLGATIPGTGGLNQGEGISVGTGLGMVGGGLAGGAVGSGIGGKVGGKTGSIAGGVIGGAIGGAAMGGVLGAGVFSWATAAIGAVVGAAVGGITAAIQAGAFTKPSKVSLGAQTGTGPPGDIYRDTIKRSPFGTLSLFEDSDASAVVAQSALTLISEADTAIAAHLDTRQREIVEQYFQSAVPEGNIVSAERADDAMAKLVAERYYHAITALAGQDVADVVIGSPFNADASTIGNLQKRANEALAILRTIEEFRIGPITETQAAINGINKEFQLLIDKANTLGIPVDEIVAEQQRQLTEITTSFNQDVADSILAITDPIAAEWEALDRQQEERMANAIDAGANLVEVERLNALEREALAERLSQASQEAGDAIRQNLIEQIQAFVNQNLSSFTQQINALRDRFVELRTEAIRLGVGVDQLSASYQQQANAIRQAAQNTFLSALYQITSPFHASMIQLNQQLMEFQKLVAEGVISQEFLDSFRQLAAEQLRFQEAMRIASGQGGAEEQFQNMVDAFLIRGSDMTDTEKQAHQLRLEFERLAAAMEYLGLPTAELEESYRKQLEEINKQDTGGGGGDGRNKAEERKNLRRQIDDFIAQSGSQYGSQLRSLKQSYQDLIEQAKELGVSTKGLTRAYKDQSAEIRRAAAESVRLAVLQFADPMKASLMQLQQQVREFRKIADDGLIPHSVVSRYRRLAMGDIAIQNALQHTQGGPQSPIKQLADSFSQFIQAGKPMSQSNQQLQALVENFRGLSMAAQSLGLSQKELTKSFIAQVKEIKKQAIEAIDQQLQPRWDQLKEVDNYMKQLRIGAELPAQMRLDEARTQFRAAVSGGNISEALQAAEQYREISRATWGGSEHFFTARNEIQSMLEGMRDREQKAIEAERARLIRQEEREAQQVMLQKSSMDSLRFIRASSSDTSRGVRDLANIARAQYQETVATRRYIMRVMDKIKA